MGSRSWGVELWDQLDFLLQFENDQLSVNDHHYRFLCDIQKLVADFGKRFRKTVSNFSSKQKSNTSIESSLTYNTAFKDSFSAFLAVGSAFETYGNKLQDSINILKTEYDRERKIVEKVAASYTKHTSNRDKEKKRVEDCWKNHVNALKERQKAEILNTTAQGDSNVSHEERQKVQNSLSSKKVAFIDTEQTYASAMSKFNENQRHYFMRDLLTSVVDLETLDRKRANGTKEHLVGCSSSLDVLANQLCESAQSLRQISEGINAEEDCNAILTAKKTGYLFPVDLPFLNLSQCSQATLNSQSALISLMLGTSSGVASKAGAPKVSKGIFGKAKAQNSDGNILTTPFITGIGLKPVKEEEMTIIQLNDRIKNLKGLSDIVESSLSATQRLIGSLVANPRLGDKQESEETMATLRRQAYSINELIGRLESRYASLGGDHALAEALSSLECANPYEISRPIDATAIQGKQSESSGGDSDVEESDPSQAGFGNYVGQATLNYDCDGGDQGCVSGKAGETFYVLEVDNDGSGWTAVVSADGSQHGFLPTTHLSIKLY